MNLEIKRQLNFYISKFLLCAKKYLQTWLAEYMAIVSHSHQTRRCSVCPLVNLWSIVIINKWLNLKSFEQMPWSNNTIHEFWNWYCALLLLLIQPLKTQVLMCAIPIPPTASLYLENVTLFAKLKVFNLQEEEDLLQNFYLFVSSQKVQIIYLHHCIENKVSVKEWHDILCSILCKRILFFNLAHNISIIQFWSFIQGALKSLTNLLTA